MTVTPKISINEGNLVVQGKTILTGVPDNIVLTPGSGGGLVAGTFIGATASHSKSLHVFPMGTLDGLRFMCCFRFKLWWMTQRMGTCGKDVPFETQFMLIESKETTEGGEHDDAPTIYTVFLPLLEGQFRAVLQGNDKNEIEICLESGDTAVETNQGLHLVYMHSGTNPFEVIDQAVKAVEKHMQTFLHREKKKLPSFLDWFGWCTWDAFYTDVTAEGIEEGLQRENHCGAIWLLLQLVQGGAPPKFLIIDDGWQQIGNENKDNNCVVQEGAQFANRLTGIKENEKFQKNGRNNEQVPGLKHVVEDAKQRHNVKFVYVWHALAGYWGGVKPAAAGMEHYECALAYPVQSPGVMGNQPDIVMDSLSVHGLGLVPPRTVFNFYNELHAYLASCGVDGVKVDVQNIIETLGAGHGGRVALTRSYQQALEASIARNFTDNGCISCMCHNTDGLYSTKQTASLHPAAEYHGAARAVGGCAIYVSDKPGHHNFELLRKLVLPDGSVLRASYLGAGWCKIEKKTRVHDTSPDTLTGSVCAADVDQIAHVAGTNWKGDVVVYAYKSGEVVRLPEGASLPVTLKVLEFEVFHFCPLKEIATNISFAPIGLLDMLNSGGAVEQFEVHMASEKPELFDGEIPFELSTSLSENRSPTATIALTARGCGRFGAYSSQRPLKCQVGDAEVEFSYDPNNGLLTFTIPIPEEEMYRWSIAIQV
ncbi:putative galactinol--sucrose galactosyltransferase 2 [Vitis vinifera]|uniref:galactinol--sucrose galactosyltransferase n=1 Tax=Vitis vinifera TaxID=29760 RepID=A0A438C009_VITVI|nr:putative galactinol--sucrose galactosyltransferase 2 [Vitis vinifera]